LAKIMPKPKWDDLPLRLVDLSAPVRDASGKFMGVICGHLSLDWAFEARDRMLANLSDKAIDMLVLNHDGRVLLGTPALPSLSLDLSVLQSYQQAKEGVIEPQVEFWPDQKPYLTVSVLEPGFRAYTGMGWSIVAREEEATAFAPARALGRNVVVLGILFSMLFAALLWWILNRQLRPLEKVSLAAEKIRAQDLTATIPSIQGHDEIAVFARSLTGLVDDLRAKNEELRLTSRVFEESGQGIVITDEKGRMVRVNRAFSEITQYGEKEVIGNKPSMLQSKRHDAEFYRRMWESLADTGVWRGEIWNRNKEGEIYPEWLNINALYGEEGKVTHYIGLFDDITEKKEYEAKLLHLANYDSLTDLPNRHLLQQKIQTAIEQARASTTRLGVLFVDLDQFKHINDTLGHPAGDVVLTEVARRFREKVGENQTLARWGGDEFVVVLPGGDENAAAATAKRLMGSLTPPFSIEQNSYHIGASIGIAMYPQDNRSVDGLLRCADTAMYQAKQEGKKRYAFYEKSMNARVEQFLLIDNALRSAIDNDELYLAFQPQFEITGKRVVGVEALLRWRHPTLGNVSPVTFIPIAEETGHIIELGWWVIEEAMRAYSKINADNGRPIAVSINLSARQLMDAKLPDRLDGLARTNGVTPSLFQIEVTESAIMSDEQAAINVLYRFREYGFPISIDDFGTGYSCLNYINRIKPQEIKIDQSFVQNITTSADSRNIVTFTVGLAKTMGMAVVAEGVETPEQLSMLRDIGEMRLQGFLLSQPMRLSELMAPNSKQDG
jgi:diguanylate cyclase (GGDEF)-like protein/PAS domain S-box-containing protein